YIVTFALRKAHHRAGSPAGSGTPDPASSMGSGARRSRLIGGSAHHSADPGVGVDPQEPLALGYFHHFSEPSFVAYIHQLSSHETADSQSIPLTCRNAA